MLAPAPAQFSNLLHYEFTQTQLFPSDRRELTADSLEYFYNKEEGVIAMDGQTPTMPKVGGGGWFSANWMVKCSLACSMPFDCQVDPIGSFGWLLPIWITNRYLVSWQPFRIAHPFGRFVAICMADNQLNYTGWAPLITDPTLRNLY